MTVHQPLGVLAVRYADAPYVADNAVPFIRSLLAEGDSARALKAAMLLRDANPGSSDAQALVGDVRMASGDSRGAAADYRTAMTIRRGPLMLERLVSALRASGQDGAAEAAAQAYLEGAPGDLTAMRLLAAGTGRNGRWEDAARLLDALAQRGQGGPLSLAQRAVVALGEGDQPRALDYARLAYSDQPASPLAAQALADALQRSGDRGPLAGELARQARLASAGSK